MKFRTLTVVIALTATLLFSHNASAMEIVPVPVTHEGYMEWPAHIEKSCTLPDGKKYTATGHKNINIEGNFWKIVVNESLDGEVYAVQVVTFVFSSRSLENIVFYHKDVNNVWTRFNVSLNGIKQEEEISSYFNFAKINATLLFGNSAEFFGSDESCVGVIDEVFGYVMSTR